MQDIQSHPEKHKHDFNGLMKCCKVMTDFNGYMIEAFDLSLLEAHKKLNIGMNGGERCDVVKGPCACGVWH
jgi:hypothetical protein